MDTALTLEPEIIPYWNSIKDASQNIKLALISLLSESLRISQPKAKKTKKALTTVEIREQKTKEVLAKLPKIKKSELTISPEVMAVVANVPQMDEDVDYDKIKYDYLMEKYG